MEIKGEAKRGRVMFTLRGGVSQGCVFAPVGLAVLVHVCDVSSSCSRRHEMIGNDVFLTLAFSRKAAVQPSVTRNRGSDRECHRNALLLFQLAV